MIHPWGWINEERIFVLHQNLGGIVNIHWERGDVPGDISKAEGNLEAGGDVQTDTTQIKAVYIH